MSGQYGTLIKIFTELTRHGQPLTVTMPGTQTRNYTHVSDIVDGLLLVGEKGQGDGYGIGADQSYSVLEIARMFGGEVMMMPERMGNRLCGSVDNAQVKALGWQQKYTIESWIKNIVHTVGLVEKVTPRILVFSTTYLPDAGPAERALVDLATALPHIEFDIVTTVFSPAGREYVSTLPNVTLHRVGVGSSYDKYRLLFSGARLAHELQMKHSYIFAWSLFASYGAFAAVLARVWKSDTPLLITLADQKLNGIAWYTKFLLGHLLAKADQVYALDTSETQVAVTLSKRSSLVRSIGDGDAFANQIRFAYTQLLMQRIHTYHQ